jgi:hypothetical protein
VSSWAGNTSGKTGAELFSVLLALWGVCALWAAGWAVAGRIAVHHARFWRHFVIGILACLSGLTLVTIGDWLAFFFPDSPLPGFFATGTMIALAAATVAAHLTFASAMPKARRLRTGATVGAILLAVITAAGLTNDDKFTDVPTIVSTLKPIDPRWVPMASVDEFAVSMKRLREESDSLALKLESDSAESR